jgi:hypothetical protein
MYGEAQYARIQDDVEHSLRKQFSGGRSIEVQGVFQLIPRIDRPLSEHAPSERRRILAEPRVEKLDRGFVPFDGSVRLLARSVRPNDDGRFCLWHCGQIGSEKRSFLSLLY